jgi:hypothetical protein
MEKTAQRLAAEATILSYWNSYGIEAAGEKIIAYKGQIALREFMLKVHNEMLRKVKI